MFYIVIGIVLLLLSAGTIAVMVLFEIRDRRAGNIQQGKDSRKSRIPKHFLLRSQEPMNPRERFKEC